MSRSGSDTPSFIRSVVEIVRRDLSREMRSLETLPSMVLFGLLTLFIFSLGRPPEKQVTALFGPVVLWVTIFFSASIGVHRMFTAERDQGAFLGLLAAPIDRTAIYLGKLVSSWIFCALMAIIVMGCFVLFYNPSLGWSYLYLAGLVGLVLFDYLAVGVILSAMTHTLRGGEVVLRILLFSVMIPVFLVATRATQPVLSDGRLPADAIKPVGALIGMGALYLAAGTWLFEKVVED